MSAKLKRANPNVLPDNLSAAPAQVSSVCEETGVETEALAKVLELIVWEVDSRLEVADDVDVMDSVELGTAGDVMLVESHDVVTVSVVISVSVVGTAGVFDTEVV